MPEWIPQDWPIWAVITVILLVNTLPKISSWFGEKVVPERLKQTSMKLEADLKTQEADLKAKADEIAWNRRRIEKSDEREEKRLETLDDIRKTLVFMQAALEQGNKDHRDFSMYLEKQSNHLEMVYSQSTKEHDAMLTAITTSQNLYNLMISKLDERRHTDYDEHAMRAVDGT